MHGDPNGPKILILTPVKDAVKHLDRYIANLARLTFGRGRLSLGMLESDSRDGTFDALRARHDRFLDVVSSVKLITHDFGFHMGSVPRTVDSFQKTRRSILARSRNMLLMRALDEQDWVLWLDVDVYEYPQDIIERLLSYDLDIVHPHCVVAHGGRTFDLNGWAAHGKRHLSDFRGAPGPVRLDAVGGTMLLVRADRHREGLVFPPFPYGLRHRAVRPPGPDVPWGEGEIETEGFGLMASDMGLQCWGLPDLEIVHR